MTVYVACVKWGTKYPAFYVERLRNMVRRNFTVPHRFVCFTDDPTGLDGIECLPLRDGWPGWWGKLSLFRADAFPEPGTVLFFDLDVVIINNIDHLLDDPGGFRICDEFPPHRMGKNYNSSVFRFEAGEQSHVHSSYVEALAKKGGEHAVTGGDQNWIFRQVPNAKLWPKEKVVSYKWGLPRAKPVDTEAGRRSVVVPPPEVSVVIFHGEPKPDQLLDGSYRKGGSAPFVAEHWR